MYSKLSFSPTDLPEITITLPLKFERLLSTYMNMKTYHHTKYLSLIFALSLLLLPAAHADADTDSKNPATTTSDCAKSKAQTEDVSFLGVYTTKVPPALAEEQGLTRGFYLLIAQVESGSPASQAGLRSQDILKKIDNQILINPEQLRELIRSKKPGHTIGLTYIRDGVEHTSTAKLESRAVSVSQNSPPMPSHNGGDHSRTMQNLLKKHGLDLEELQRKGNVHTFQFALPGNKNLDQEIRKKLRERGIDLDKLQNSGHVHSFNFGGSLDNPSGIIVGRNDLPKTSSSSSATVKVDSQLHFNINDDHGSLSLLIKGVKGDLEVKDSTGKTLYKGSYTPGQKIKNLPHHWQKRLEELDLQAQSQSASPKKKRKKSKKKSQ